jgi:uncharacterized protein (DUF1697 family)
MTTYVALLRGINVGKAKRVAMADLRALVEELGHTDVATVLMSGNLVFSSSKRGAPALAKGIEGAIRDRLGMDVRVLVRTAAEVRKVVDDVPFADEAAREANRLQVTFLDGAPDRQALRPVLEADWSPEAVAVGDGVVYAWQPNGMTGSKLGEALVKVPGPVATTRNLATLQKILAKT